MKSGLRIVAIVVFVGLSTTMACAGEKSPKPLVLSRAAYLDRVQAIWTGQMIGQWTGLQFEHQPASVLNPTPLRTLPGYATVDDDYYYEMVAIRAFEKYGIHLTVRQLGQQWLENNAGSWGSSEQALLLLKRGIEAPDTGNPRYNKLWWTIGPQFSSDVYGALNPGRPNDAAEMARRLTHINGYAEGVDGAVFISGMISLGFVESDTTTIVREAATLIAPESPYRQCLDMAIGMADADKSPEEIFKAVNDRWGIEYPATNNAVVNGAIVATSVWFGKGDFSRSENLAFTAADYSDADCNAANVASVIAAMHGMAALPKDQVGQLHDRIDGTTMGSLKLTPPFNESISELALRTSKIGEALLLEHGTTVRGDTLQIPVETPHALAPELFSLSELTRWWNPDWTLERAGFGGAGGGLEGIRGDTYLDGDTLAIWPRDEVRGALLRRKVRVSDDQRLTFDAGADAGRTWRLAAYLNNKPVLTKLIEGGPVQSDGAKDRHWEHFEIDLQPYRSREVVIRLYDLVLVPDHYAGNSYWRQIEIK